MCGLENERWALRTIDSEWERLTVCVIYQKMSKTRKGAQKGYKNGVGALRWMVVVSETGIESRDKCGRSGMSPDAWRWSIETENALKREEGGENASVGSKTRAGVQKCR
jgi:hypothetical protein